MTRKVLRSAMLAGCALAVFAAAEPTMAQAATYHFDIPAEDLTTALRAFARAAHQQIVFDEAVTRGKSAPALSGDYDVDTGLGRLLASTGLRFERTATDVLTIVRDVERLPGASASPGEEDAAAPATLEEVTVTATGTNIRGAKPVGAKLTVIGRQQIEDSGYTQVADIVGQLSQFSRSAASEITPSPQAADSTLRNFNGGSGLNLRNLGADSTLVLVDGRRQPGAGVNGVFVDVSTIPAAAIERVEILPDGASAIYGSDAVGGVVNFILRKDFDGAQSSVRYVNFEGGIPEVVASQLLGTNWNGGNFLVGYQFDHRDRLPNSKRSYVTDDLRPFGGTDQRQNYCSPGTILDPNTFLPAYGIPAHQNGVGLSASSLGAPNYCNSQTDVLQSRTTHDVFAHLSQRLGDRLEFTGDVRYENRRSLFLTNGSQDVLTVPSSNPFYVNPFGGTGPVNVAYDFVNDLGRITNNETTEAAVVSGDLSAKLWRDWHGDLAASYGRQKDDDLLTNIANFNTFAAVLSDPNPATALNVFGGPAVNNPTTLNALRTFQRDTGISREWDLSFTATGTLVELPAGPMKGALGTQYIDSRIHANTRDLGRADVAEFAEVRVPLVGASMGITAVRTLDVSAAVRRDDYSDFGSTTNSKFGASWSPISGLTFRGTWGTSFKAPRLVDLSNSSGSIRVLNLVDPSSSSGHTESLFLLGNNPNLKPETATVYTFGADLEFPQAFHVSMTYFDVDYRNRIERPGPSGNPGAVLEFPTTWASVITRNPTAQQIATLCSLPVFIVGSCPGAVPIGAAVDLRLHNLAVFQSRGVDVEISKPIEWRENRFNIALSATYTLDFDEAVTANAPAMNLVGTYANTPRLKGVISGSWVRGPWRLTTAINHVSGSVDPASTVHPNISPWTTWDLGLGYKFQDASGPMRGVDLHLAAVNVTNANPPFADVMTTGYDTTNASPLGRVVSFDLVKTW